MAIFFKSSKRQNRREAVTQSYGPAARSPSCRMDVWFASISLVISSQNEAQQWLNDSCQGLESRERGWGMRKWAVAVGRFLENEDGPTAVEYAVMLALIIVVCLGAITTLGQNSNSVFKNVGLNGTLQGSAS
jgi:pilus assembly protein Flp/PilA